MQNQIKFKKNIILKRILFSIILILACYIIFNFSAQSGEASGSLSKQITEYVVEIISKIKNMDIDLKLKYIEALHPIIRKLAHFSIYFIVGFSAMGLMCTFNMKNIYKFITSISIGLVYAISDEIHQSFIPGRGPAVFDVFIDFLGVLTGVFVLMILIILVENIINWLKR